MRLLTITLLMTLNTGAFAAGADGTSGSPEAQLISMTPIDSKLSLACYVNNSGEEVTCIVVEH